MKTFFEYLYYRIAKLNFVKNYERAIISVTVCQTLIVMNIAFFLIYGPLKIKGKFNTFEMFFILAIFFGLDYYNSKLYKGKYDKLNEKWGNQSKKDKIMGMIIVVSFIILCWGLVFINGWLYKRLK